MDESEYQFENTFEDPATYNSNSEAQALKQEASKQLADQMRSKFQEMPKAMIAEHGKDLLAEAENDSNAASASASGTSTPATGAATAKSTASSNTSATTSTTASKSSAKRVSTTRITKQEDFMIVSGCSKTEYSNNCTDTDTVAFNVRFSTPVCCRPL